MFVCIVIEDYSVLDYVCYVFSISWCKVEDNNIVRCLARWKNVSWLYRLYIWVW